MKATAFLIVLFSVVFTTVLAATCTIPSTDVSANGGNPLRGLAAWTYWDDSLPRNNIPHSLEYTEIPMSDLMTGMETFDLSSLEDHLNRVSARGNQLIVKVYIDYPGSASGIPQFLLDAGITVYSHSQSGGGITPEYSDELMETAMVNLIWMMGVTYDNDPRLAFIELGFLGYWASWSNYPNDHQMATRSVQKRLIESYHYAFPNTMKLVPQWEMDHWDIYSTFKTSDYAIGYYEEDFPHSSYSSSLDRNPYRRDWHFYAYLEAHEELSKWKDAPIGGNIQRNKVFKDTWGGQNYETAVDVLHVTYLLNWRAFGQTMSDVNDNELTGARNKALELGYMMEITSMSTASVENGLCSDSTTGCVAVTVTIANNGVAPFYYDLSVTVAQGASSATEDISSTFNGDAGISGTFTLYVPDAVLDSTFDVSLTSTRALRGISFAQTGATFDGVTVVCGTSEPATSDPVANTDSSTTDSSTTASVDSSTTDSSTTTTDSSTTTTDSSTTTTDSSTTTTDSSTTTTDSSTTTSDSSTTTTDSSTTTTDSSTTVLAADSETGAQDGPYTCDLFLSEDIPASGGNPFIGFMPYTYSSESELKTDIPHNLEYSYIAMNDVMTAEDSWDWTVLEDMLNNVAPRGHQMVVRFYLDYPDCCPDGQYNTGVPDFLLSGSNPVTFTSYSDHGGGKSPDYENTRLRAAMTSTIAEFGRLYDGDNRLAYIQVGFIGMWGEWHTWPHDELMPKRSVQKEILTAFDDAFDKTRFLVSQDEFQEWWPGDSFETTDVNVGWHDDNFCVASYDANKDVDWYFWARLKDHQATTRWKTVPMGGEMQPTVQKNVLRDSWSGQDYQAAVEKLHISWMLNDRVYKNALKDSNGNELSNAAEMNLMMGYRFVLDEFHVEEQLDSTLCATSNGKCAKVTLVISNTGVAPFYNDLFLQVSDGTVSSDQVQINADFVPPATNSYDLFVDVADLKTAVWSVELTCPQALIGIKFANTGSEHSGLPVQCWEAEAESVVEKGEFWAIITGVGVGLAVAGFGTSYYKKSQDRKRKMQEGLDAKVSKADYPKNPMSPSLRSISTVASDSTGYTSEEVLSSLEPRV